MTQRPRLIRRPRRAASGFTLIELMLSIALVLILLLGVNKVFQTTGDAVGAGQTINDATSEQSAAQSILADDFNNVVQDSPVFLINSTRASQYLNQADFQSSVGGNPLAIDLNNDGNAGNDAGEIISPAATNFRSHRCDTVSFFAHGRYQRRTANPSLFNSQTRAQDAYIWIGHAALPGKHPYVGTHSNIQAPFYGPDHAFGGNENDANAGMTERQGAYASDWVLARQQIVMKDATLWPVSGSTGPELALQRWIPYKAGLTNTTLPPAPQRGPDNVAAVGITNAYGYMLDLSPLAWNSEERKSSSALNPPVDAIPMQTSVYDYANVTMEQFRTIVNQANADQGKITYGSPNTDALTFWWYPLTYSLDFRYPKLSAGSVAWYDAATQTNGETADSLRFQVNTQPGPVLTSAGIAQLSPYLLSHASQFVVEYAGDYLQQDNNSATANANYGNLTGIGSDGQIDYYLDANRVKHIRWYGLPRDANGDGAIRSVSAGDGPASINYNTATGDSGYVDVVPLRDYYSLVAMYNAANPGTPIPIPYGPGASGPAPVGGAPHELDCNFTPVSNYAGYSAGGAPNLPTNARYICGWLNNTPSMVRILIKIDDPANRVPDGPWFEYVFQVKK